MIVDMRAVSRDHAHVIKPSSFHLAAPADGARYYRVWWTSVLAGTD